PVCSVRVCSCSCCSVDHRDLHSFPTRRSSDLPGRPPPPPPTTRPRRCRGWPPPAPAPRRPRRWRSAPGRRTPPGPPPPRAARHRSEEHTSELQSRENLVCRLLLEKKKENRR